LATVHLETVLFAYAGIFPPDAPAPALESQEWDAAFADPTFRAFLAEEGGTAVGTVAVRADPDVAGSGQLRRLHVRPDLWGQGRGGALYESAMAALRADEYPEAGLWVLEENGPARSFYERRGWVLVPNQVLKWPNLDTIEVRYRRSLAVAHGSDQ
jgi:GNAT superfamily N-acetyltransferase